MRVTRRLVYRRAHHCNFVGFIVFRRSNAGSISGENIQRISGSGIRLFMYSISMSGDYHNNGVTGSRSGYGNSLGWVSGGSFSGFWKHKK